MSAPEALDLVTYTRAHVEVFDNVAGDHVCVSLTEPALDYARTVELSSLIARDIAYALLRCGVWRDDHESSHPGPDGAVYVSPDHHVLSVGTGDRPPRRELLLSIFGATSTQRRITVRLRGYEATRVALALLEHADRADKAASVEAVA
jgi:hypothetical protein